MKSDTKLAIALAVIFVILLAACSTTKTTRSDRTVPDAKRNELREGGPYKALWESRDLTMNYEYSWNAERLAISGEVKLKLQKNLDSLILDANLINEAGQILLSKGIASAGGRRPVKVVSFNTQMDVPEGTRGIAFSYSITVRGFGPGSPKTYWQTPF